MSYPSILNELRCAFACGSGMVELYCDYELLDSIEDVYKRQHVYLINDKHTVFSLSRWHLYLLDKIAHILNAVVGSGIKLNDVHGGAIVKRPA